MRTPQRSSVAIFVAIFAFCGFILLFAQGRILTHTFIGTSLQKPLGNTCFILSMPGVMVALALHPDFRTRGTIVSDLIIVTINTTIYTVPLLLLLQFITRRRAHRKTS